MGCLKLSHLENESPLKVVHRNFSSEGKSDAGYYRYGFNGKEKDQSGEFGMTSYDYGFRIYNPAIAKFLSVDPLTKAYPFYTPYQFAGNKPIKYIDVDGAEEGEKPTTIYYATPINVNEDYVVALTVLQMRVAARNVVNTLAAVKFPDGYLMNQSDVVIDEPGGIPFMVERYVLKGTGELFFDYGLDLVSIAPGGANVKSFNGPIMLAKNGVKASFVQKAKQESKRILRELNDVASGRKFESNPKHGRTNRGKANKAPTNPQSSLDNSFELSENTTRRVGADKSTGEFNVFDEHTPGNFHGHSRDWSELGQDMKNVLIKNGATNRKGKIL